MPKNRWTLAGMLFAAWLLVQAFCPIAAAAPNTRFCIDKWSVEEGLPQSSVITMVQTRDGYLWLGTLNGLVRFDGIRFKVFDENNTPGLNSSRIVHLFEDSQTNLWIGTETAGAALVKDGRVISLDLGRGSREGRVVAACEDESGAVWLFTADNQLMRHYRGKVDVFAGPSRPYLDQPPTLIREKSGAMWEATEEALFGINPPQITNTSSLFKRQIIGVSRVKSVLASKKGGFWLLANGKVQKWANNQVQADLGPYPWDPNKPISAVCEDEQGNLVVGTHEQGVFWFDAQGVATCLSTNNGLSHNFILSLHMDHEGSLWVGTDGGGLNRVKCQNFNLLEESAGLSARSICQDNQGGLWFSSFGGIAHWNENVLTNHGTMQQRAVRAMLADRSQRVWATTYNVNKGGLFVLKEGGFQLAPGAEKLSEDISAIHQDRAGRIWVGMQGGLACWDERGWKIFTTKDGLSANLVRAIEDDAEGNLWIGTEQGGLNRLRDGQFTSFQQSNGFPSDNISALHADSEGVLWVGTLGKGLVRFYKDKWTQYTTQDGLAANGVGYLIDDEQGFLWIGSNNGLMRISKKSLNDFAKGDVRSISCRTYGKRDGLPTSECSMGSQPAACQTQDGKLWFPTSKGIASVDPASIKPNTNPPPVVIESVLVEGNEQAVRGPRTILPETVIVPPGTERLEIHYTSLNLASPDRTRFRYWMEELGDGTLLEVGAWKSADNLRVLLYPKLPPGNYRFHVTACNEDGVWNEKGASVAIRVQPEFWQTRGFVVTTGLFFLAMVTGMVRYVSTQKLQRQLAGLRQQQALEKERARIARDIHDQVGASLTQVSFLGEMVESDKDLPEEVEQHARQISQTARETSRALDEIVWTVNPSNDTLDGLINYVCKHAQEYLAVAGLRYRLEVPDQLPATPISPEARHNVFLAAKEAVTNVVKHAKASEVWIRLCLEPSRFTLEIEDNGRGPCGMDDPAKQTRNGLRNMRKRMEDVGGEFSIVPGHAGGSLVRLTVPIGQH